MNNVELYKQLEQRNVELRVKMQQLEQEQKACLDAIKPDQLDPEILEIYNRILKINESDLSTDDILKEYGQIEETIKAKVDQRKVQYSMYEQQLNQYLK